MTPRSNIQDALRCGRSWCDCRGQRVLHCPAHEDRNPSLSVTQRDGKTLVKCHAGCDQTAVITALRECGLWGRNGDGGTSYGYAGDRVTNSTPASAEGLDTATLARAKSLSPECLRLWGLSDRRVDGVTRVAIPYVDADGNTLAIRYRLSMTGARFLWRRGDKVTLYGLGRLADIRRMGWVLVVEGESDVWTAWYYGIPAIGIPGKSTWRSEWAAHLDGLDVYLWEEPDAADLTLRVARDIPRLRVIRATEGAKDISAVHIAGRDARAYLQERMPTAIPAQDIISAETDRQVGELRQRAASVLAHDDPLELVRAAIRGAGYGGDITACLVTYCAATSRVLAMRPGTMPVHLVLLGPPSAGKSYTMKTVLQLLPEDAYHVIDAGSPRVVIYAEADLKHRVLIFGEADSLPAGEDNPAASAVRNLAQDNELHYKVTVRDPETGDFAVREVRKPGPTVLITTAVRPMGGQLMTRLFTLDITGDREQIRAALAAQAAIETDGTQGVDDALIAYQGYLQALAPWNVVVPYAGALADAIGQSHAAPRLLRDYQRLLSLVKSVTVLRHTHRERNRQGRLVADVEDYRAVFGLINEIYAASVTGVTDGVTNLVTKVRELKEQDPEVKVTYARLSKELDVHRDLVRRRANTAVRTGWLVNRETRRGHQADLATGDPLPVESGLPEPDTLVCHPVTPVTDGYTHTSSRDDELRL